jgi:hypothetical protein
VAVADAVTSGVLTVMGVHVGVGVPAEATVVAPGEGMTSTCPARIRAGLVMLFADASALVVTSKREAISESVSPGRTV